MSGKGLLVSLVIVCFNTPAAAQIGDAVAAFNNTLRKAQRLLNSNPGSQRQKRRLAGIAIPPPPARSPLRAGAKTNAPQPRELPNQSRKSSLQKPLLRKSEEGAQPSALRPPERIAATANVVGQPAGNENPDRQQASPSDAPPPPDVWSKEEIIAAQQTCIKILARVDAVVEQLAPIKKGPCGEPAPIKLSALKGKQAVRFKPAATLNCPMLQALDTWVRRGLQPTARKHLGAPITTISVMSSYSCRNAYGRKTTNLSEHGKANALDIGGFYTDDGARTDLAGHWGPTKRDIVAAAQKKDNDKQLAGAAESSVAGSASVAGQRSPQTRPVSAGQKITGNPAGALAAAVPQRSSADPLDIGRSQQQSAATVIVLLPPPLPKRRPSLRQRHLWAKAERERQVLVQPISQRREHRDELNSSPAFRKNLGGPKPKDAQKISEPQKPKIDRAAFLRGAHRTACRIFGTVLGPEANDAHRDHFHVDLAARKHKNYCR